jgi:16S rRNA (cytidine1402-2'-O)-methyltransferase
MRTKAREGGGEEMARERRDGSDPVFRAAPGTLYVVATPLGNLRDLTLRARDILATADIVASEDTRVTGNLLAHFGISARPTPIHAHNEARRSADVVLRLGEGRSVALVSDAGTPGVSDPGARVVEAARAAGFPVVPIPGPCALAAAVSAAGLAAERFVFLGFLPPSPKARRELLAGVAPLPLAIVLYEAPHRVRSTVSELAVRLPGRDLVVARELTKVFETIARMPIAEADAWFEADANRVRGEFVLLLDAPGGAQEAPSLDAGTERWLAALAPELPPSRVAKLAAAVTGLDRDVLYARAVALRGDAG